MRGELKERGFEIMAEPTQRAWQQLPGESHKAFQAFVVYRKMELKERSLQRVGSELGKSRGLIERWSSRWDWVERVRAWDDYLEMRRLENRIEEKQKVDEEHLRIVRAARKLAVAALAQTKPDDLAGNVYELRNWITEFIKFERLIMGEPESIEKRSEKVEIHASIVERIREYVPVFQELIDEGAIRLEGQETTDVLAGALEDEDDGEDEVLTYDETDDE